MFCAEHYLIEDLGLGAHSYLLFNHFVVIFLGV